MSEAFHDIAAIVRIGFFCASVWCIWRGIRTPETPPSPQVLWSGLAMAFLSAAFP